MSSRVAIAVCVHHKPWLAMATLITTLLQRETKADIFIIYNVGDGACPQKPSYAKYRELFQAEIHPDLSVDLESTSYAAYDRRARERGINPKLSPFDERVRPVCQLRDLTVTEVEFDNDHALDSGVWWKFIRSGLWRPYDYLFCVQEGTILTGAVVLSSALRLASERGIDFLAGGHMKARLPRDRFLNYNTRGDGALAVDRFHDRMIRKTFDVFLRDPEFRRAFDQWPNDVRPTRQHHVPDIWGREPWSSIQRATNAVAGLPRNPLKRLAANQLRRHRETLLRWNVNAAVARVQLDEWRGTSARRSAGGHGRVHVDGELRLVDEIVTPVQVNGVTFHQETEMEWYGCGCNHMFSHRLLEQLSTRMECHDLYEAIDLPFAGTALELVWGFMPSWLGFDKWFFDGFHRVAKNFATYRREDVPMDMANLINRYYPGKLAVDWCGDHLKVRRAGRPIAESLESCLAPCYF